MTMLFDPPLEIERLERTHRARSVAGDAGLQRIISRLLLVTALSAALWSAGLRADETGTEASSPAAPGESGAGVEASAAPPPAAQTEPAGEAPAAEPGEEPASESPSVSEGQQPPPMPVPAVWFERDIEFAYMPRTTYYTCDGLKSKVSQILKQMGVKPGFKVTIGSCFEAQGISSSRGLGYTSRGGYTMPVVRIRAAFPTEATPEVLAELEKTAPEREMLRRYQGLPTDFDPAIDQFAAVRTVIIFKDGRLGPIEAGDCELIETMRDKVFVPVGMRIVEDRMGCQPGQVSMGSINMKVEILEQPQPAEATPGKEDKDGKNKLSVEPRPGARPAPAS
jgi:hypothetical protein